MVELACTEQPGQYRQGFAGDSFNTAVYLARSGLQVDYFTHLGDDTFSREIVQLLGFEGIGQQGVTCRSGRQPGLYIINNDDHGERVFSYWRDSSPAREMFDQPVSLHDYDLFYFTGITLAVCRSGLENLVALLQQLGKENCRIAFDPNYRPHLWQGREQAQAHYREVLPLCDLVLPTMEDEAALWGLRNEKQCQQMYQQFGVPEVVIKGDQLVAHHFCSGAHTELKATPVAALDTTGAGDAFNAGYLAAWLEGEAAADAITSAQTLAAAVVQHRGAIMPRVDET